MLFAVWCFHHSTFSAQRYDNFQERQKHTIINLLFWREWNLPLAKFLSVENNKPLKDLRTVWMVGYQVKTYYLCCSLFLLFRQSFISVAGCRFKPSRWIKKVLELFTLQRRKKLLQTVYRLTFSYSNEVWLPLHPTKGINGRTIELDTYQYLWSNLYFYMSYMEIIIIDVGFATKIM